MNRILPRPSPQLALLLAIVAGVLYFLYGDSLKDWGTPLRYVGDSLSYGLIVKGVLDSGWFPSNNAFLGAPFGASSFDIPVSEGANFVLIHLLGMFGDWAFVTNAYFVLSYFLVAGSAYWVLCRFGLRGPWPVAGALLYAFLPYHALRIEHLFLAAYYAVPLGVWLAWTVGRGAAAAAERGDRTAILVCSLIVGSSGIYYAFFACYLVVVAMLASAGRGSLRRGVAVLALIVGTVVANVLPTLVWQAAKGPNPDVAVRPYKDTETYGLKVVQMVLPRPGHRLESASKMNDDYAAASEVVNENTTAALGLAGVAGFAFLLWRALRRIYAGGEADVVDALAAFNLAGVLLGTVGGLGAVVSLLVSAQIRSYNRVSVVIAFVAIAGLMFGLSRLCERRMPALHGAKFAYPVWFVAALLVAMGIFDQTSAGDLTRTAANFDADRAFVQTLEARLPRGTSVYQMPHQGYPEVGNQYGMEGYGPARGYLHSKSLRWSYGHMKGREGDHWMRVLGQLPVARQLEMAAASGFGAIVVDRRGYPDAGKAVLQQLGEALGPPAVASSDGSQVAFVLRPTGTQPVPLESLQTPFESVDLALPFLPASITRLTGFSGHEPWGRWTEGPIARIDLAKSLPREFALRIQSVMALDGNVGTPIVVSIGGVEREFTVGAKLTDVEVRFKLDGPANSIEMRVPRPVSPLELGFSSDKRKLGIGIKSVAVAPN